MPDGQHGSARTLNEGCKLHHHTPRLGVYLRHKARITIEDVLVVVVGRLRADISTGIQLWAARRPCSVPSLTMLLEMSTGYGQHPSRQIYMMYC